MQKCGVHAQIHVVGSLEVQEAQMYMRICLRVHMYIHAYACVGTSTSPSTSIDAAATGSNHGVETEERKDDEALPLLETLAPPLLLLLLLLLLTPSRVRGAGSIGWLAM